MWLLNRRDMAILEAVREKNRTISEIRDRINQGTIRNVRVAVSRLGTAGLLSRSSTKDGPHGEFHWWATRKGRRVHEAQKALAKAWAT